MRISDWTSDVCSSDLPFAFRRRVGLKPREPLVPQVKEEIRCPVTLQLASSRTVRKSGRAQRAVVKKHVGEAGNRIAYIGAHPVLPRLAQLNAFGAATPHVDQSAATGTEACRDPHNVAFDHGAPAPTSSAHPPPH